MSVRYDDRYRREPQGWRFEYVRITLKVLSPYDQGFAKARIADVYGTLSARG
jgi:hypothetical protein